MHGSFLPVPPKPQWYSLSRCVACCTPGQLVLGQYTCMLTSLVRPDLTPFKAHTLPSDHLMVQGLNTAPPISHLTSAALCGLFTTHRCAGVFFVFYWAINVGSLAASLSIPLIMRHAGPHVAFGVPGICMALATAIFFWGREGYTCMPAVPSNGQPGVLQVAAFAGRHHVMHRWVGGSA